MERVEDAEEHKRERIINRGKSLRKGGSTVQGIGENVSVVKWTAHLLYWEVRPATDAGDLEDFYTFKSHTFLNISIVLPNWARLSCVILTNLIIMVKKHAPHCLT